MSIVSPPFSGTSAFALPPYPVWRFSVAEYHRLLETGILGEDDRVELLEGWIVPKMPHSPEHDRAIELADEEISRILPAGWRIRIQSAITTPDSEPEPDLAVVRGSIRSTANRHPEPRDLGLLVEVSDSSLSSDRTEKGRLYASASILNYWIVNLVDLKVEVYSDPTGPAAHAQFRQRRDFLPGSAVPLILDGTQVGQIAVSDLLP